MQLLIININKKLNVFKVKYLKKVMHSHDIQSQSDELVPNGTFSNIVHILGINTEKNVMIVEINNHSSNNKTLAIDSHSTIHIPHTKSHAKK